MLYLNLKADDESLYSSVELLRDKLNIGLQDGGITVTAVQSKELSVSFDGKVGQISYITRASFFRMLTLFVRNYEETETFSLKESIEIKDCGMLLDVSRGGVMKPEALLEYMKYMAMMGLNYLYLYIEDIYTIPELPYFGYMRGRYSEEELKEIDAYGVSLGIEVIPAMQTMSHLEQYLKWGENCHLRSSYRTLLVGEEDTYKLIDQMFAALSRCFTTKKIHIGMDEAWDLNKEGYLKKNGMRPMGQVVAEHVTRILELTEKYGYEPIGWEWIENSEGGDELIKKIPNVDKMTNTVWDYAYFEDDAFDERCNRFKRVSPKVAVVGPTWTWEGSLPDNKYTIEMCEHLLSACKRNHIQNVAGSVWGDDGTECSHFYSLLGAQFYAEHMYQKTVNREHLKKRFEWTVQTSYDAFMDMSDFQYTTDEISAFDPKMREGYILGKFAIGKKLLWQDIMEGLMDYQLFKTPMSQYYKELSEKFNQYKNAGDYFQKHYAYIEKLFDVLALKCFIAERLKKEYEVGNKLFLQKCKDELLPELSTRIDEVRKMHRDLWHRTYKPFGFEVIDVRYSGLQGRIDTAIYRLGDYLEGRVQKLEELEEMRLNFEIFGGRFYNAIFSANSRRPS